MSKRGTISPIKDEPTSELTTKNSLLRAKKPMTRTPGTGVWMTPDLELTGKYRTGLDEEADYLKKMDPKDRKVEQERIKALREKLERALGLESNGSPSSGLGPYSEFWNYGKRTSTTDNRHINIYKLQDDDNHFNFDDPWQELNFTWLSVSRRIASSLQAYKRGEFPGAQFYVQNAEAENKIAFAKKKEINRAIVLLDDMTPTTMKRVGRLMGLPISDNSKDEEVYKLIDDALKQTEFRSGEHRGGSPVRIFTRFAEMKDELLEVNDLAKQLVSHNVVRRRNVEGVDGLYRGDAKIAANTEELVKILLNDEQQELRISLESQLKNKQLIAV